MGKLMRKLICFLFIFVIINGMVSFVMIPADGSSKSMWKNYEEKEELDTIYIGASVCQSTFNPAIIDEILGTNSYNMGTPAQPLELSYMALETAVAEHDIERVVFGFGYFTLIAQESEQAEAAFLQARNEYVPLLDAVKTDLEYIFSDENRKSSTSINYVIPWINNHVSFETSVILENINKKIANLLGENEETQKTEWKKNGYQPFTDVIDYDNVGDLNTWSCYQPEFYIDSIETMERICKMCRDEGIELIVVNTPHPTFDITSYGSGYYDTYLWLKEFFADNQAEYYDFNFAMPEIFESKPEYYYNFEHLNNVGADVFSADFANFLQMKDSGVDMEQYFYNWEEYLESVSFVYE